MAKKRSSNGTTGEWQKLNEQEKVTEEQLEAARTPLYMLERALDYCLSYLVDRLNSDADEARDVTDPTTWYHYRDAIKHASELVESGLEQSGAAHRYVEEMDQLEMRVREVGAPPEVRARWATLRRPHEHVRAERAARS